jgi:hypothetical protein
VGLASPLLAERTAASMVNEKPGCIKDKVPIEHPHLKI